MPAAFDKAVKEHALATEALAWLKPGQTAVDSSLNFGRQIAKHAPFYGWSLRGIGTLESGPTLYRSQAMEDFVKGLRATRRSDEAAVCLKFAQAYLNHADPRYRAIACEFLAHFPLEMIDMGLLPAIARRLGDSATAFDGATFGMGQQDTFITHCANGVSVADVAREALACGTGLQFRDAKAFDVWWQGNGDYRHRLWYWAMRWERLPYPPPTPPGADPSKTPVATPMGKVSVETEFPTLLAAVGPEEGLKTLLLATNPRAVATQSGAKWGYGGGDPRVIFAADAPVWLGCPQLFSEPNAIAGFVQEHSLKPRLLEVLRQDQPWPEVVANDSKNDLLSCVVEVLKIVATKSDAPAIQDAIAQPTPALKSDPALQTRLTLLLTSLAPERSEQILLWQFQQNPTYAHAGLAAELIRTTGLRHWDVIAPAAQDRNIRARVLAPLGALRTPQAAKVLGGLLAGERLAGEDLEAQIARCGVEIDGGELFEQYVNAATLLNGNQSVIGKDLFERALCVGGKGGPSEKGKEHNRGVPAARAEAIEKLKEFFNRAASPAH